MLCLCRRFCSVAEFWSISEACCAHELCQRPHSLHGALHRPLYLIRNGSSTVDLYCNGWNISLSFTGGDGESDVKKESVFWKDVLNFFLNISFSLSLSPCLPLDARDEQSSLSASSSYVYSAEHWPAFGLGMFIASSTLWTPTHFLTHTYACSSHKVVSKNRIILLS